MKDKYNIIIVNYNSGKNLLNCLLSLQNQTNDLQLKTVIVDNNSQDDSLIVIKQKYPYLKIILNNNNLGFAKANNIAIKYCLEKGADYIYLINPDTISQSGSISSLLKTIKTHKNIGIVSPVLKVRKDGKELYDIGAGFNKILGRTKHIHQNNKLNGDIEQELVSGCAMLIKKEVFKKINYFDEQFFLYFEDSDFCLRAKKAGFKIMIAAKALVDHKISSSFEEKSWKKIYYLAQSNILFIKKNVCWYFWPLAYLYVILLIMMMIIKPR